MIFDGDLINAETLDVWNINVALRSRAEFCVGIESDEKRGKATGLDMRYEFCSLVPRLFIHTTDLLREKKIN